MNSQQEELGRKKINSEGERKKWRGGEGKRRKKIRAAIRCNSFAIFPFLFPSIFIFIFHLFIYLYIYFFLQIENLKIDLEERVNGSNS